MHRARPAVAIAAARTMAAAEIVVVTEAATVAVADDGAAVADASGAEVARKVPEVAICLLLNMLRRKATLVETSRAVTTIAAAISAARKIAGVRRVVLSLAAPHSAALTTVRRKLRVPPLLALPRKNPFFSRANRSPSIVESPQVRLHLQWPSRKFASRNPISKTEHLALPAA